MQWRRYGKKIIIIGGGIAGLSAEVYACLSGYEVDIYEKNSIIGGECTGWNRKGLHIDNCIETRRKVMKKWYAEEYNFEIEVTGFLRSDHTENYCRNGEEIGDKYVCTYGCPVNEQGFGICSKMMQILYGDMQAVRSGGDLTLVGGKKPLVKDYVCPDGCVCFQMKATKMDNENFYKGNFYKEM